MSSSLNPEDVFHAHEWIAPHIHHTPLMSSRLLNEWLGAEIWFKAENLQVTGSFKARGALYALMQAKQKKPRDLKIAIFSSGNHAQGCAWAGHKLGIPVDVYMPEFTSDIKVQATRSYGAHVTLAPTRAIAEQLCEQAMLEGAIRIPPFDHDDVILGAATAAMEALNDIEKPQAIFATCGGGGFLSGCWLAREALNKTCSIFGCEPLQASDAFQSIQAGHILRFSNIPNSLADGARTPAVCERTFEYLRKLDDFFLASEQEIVYWCQWLSHLLKTSVEPTSAVAMVGAWKYLQSNPNKKGPLLVMISGGNLSVSCQQKIWSEPWLEMLPSRHLKLSSQMAGFMPTLVPVTKLAR